MFLFTSRNLLSCCCRWLFQLYGSDLESEFSQFQDWLKNFPLYKGRANAEEFEEDEEERLMGKYKVWSPELGWFSGSGTFWERSLLSSTLRDPSWFTPSMPTTPTTQSVRSPKESPQIRPSRSWSESTSSRLYSIFQNGRPSGWSGPKVIVCTTCRRPPTWLRRTPTVKPTLTCCCGSDSRWLTPKTATSPKS